MQIAKLLLPILVLSLVVMLSGCGPKADPIDVISEMHQAMSEVNQFGFSLDVDLAGALDGPMAQELTSLAISAQGRADLSSRDQLRYIVDLLVQGSNPGNDTRVSAEVRAFSDYSYFKIIDIALPLGLPFSLVADSQWYQVKNSNTKSENILGGGNSWLTDSQMQSVRDLLRSPKIFSPDAVLPDATVNGVRSYHITAEINPIALRNFLVSLDRTTNSKPQLNIDEIVSMLTNHTYHLWITKRDHYLTRLSVDSFYLNDAGSQVDFSILTNLTSFNVPVSISQPTNVQDFNLRHLFGLPPLGI